MEIQQVLEVLPRPMSDCYTNRHVKIGLYPFLTPSTQLSDVFYVVNDPQAPI